jgi:hypothetical protein
MRSLIKGALAVVLVGVLCIALGGRTGIAENEDETILGHIDKGRAAFVAGKTQAAIDHLQKAVGLMQQMATKSLASFFPKAPEGWKASEPSTNSGSWNAGSEVFQWNSADCSYTRTADSVKVDILITSSPQIVEPAKAMMKVYQDPQMRKMMAANPNQKIEVIDKDDWTGFMMAQQGGNASIMAFNGRTMLQLTCGSGDASILDMFWKAIDLAGLAGILSTADEEGR